jgi:hypothetical protein
VAGCRHHAPLTPIHPTPRRHASISTAWDCHDNEASLEYARKGGLRLAARLQRTKGGGGGWGQPSLVMSLEPLSLL